MADTTENAAPRRAAPALCAAVAMAVLARTNMNCALPQEMLAVDRPRPGRAIDGKVAVVYSMHYQVNLGGLERLHSFDINKYAKIHLQLCRTGLLLPEEVFVPGEATRGQIRLVHGEALLASLRSSRAVARYLEAPVLACLPAAVVDRRILRPFRYAVGGTVLAAQQALACGIAVNIGGGFHHAMCDAGEGFNVYADMAIAIRSLRKANLARRALVVDLDVHQGNGTAVIFAGDDDVFAFSMHEDDIYPIPKAVGDLDVALPAGTGDADYLRLLRENLAAAMDRARPEIVFLQAGCDVLAGDPLANLALTVDGLVKRDAMVIDACARRGVPVVMTLGGGYTKDAWHAQYLSIRRTIEAHTTRRTLKSLEMPPARP